MPTFTNTKSLYYNDVNLLGQPAHKNIKSRSDVKLEKYRIIVSPMHAIQGERFIIEAAKNGISVFLHRFNGVDWQLKMYNLFESNKIDNKQICSVSLGLKNLDADFGRFWAGNKIKNIGIDIANGYLNLSHYCKDMGFLLNDNKLDNFYVGNVNTIRGFQKLENEFKDISKNLLIRVGIGGGSPCSSSDVAGINRGNITEISQCYQYKRNGLVVADGGISKPGFAAKAFAAGAEYIMLGGYFSAAEEAETNLNGDGAYWGGASERQLAFLGQTNKTSEGKVILEKKELFPLKKLVDDLWGGLASYVTYSGSESLTEAIGGGLFEIKQNSLPPKSRK